MKIYFLQLDNISSKNINFTPKMSLYYGYKL